MQSSVLFLALEWSCDLLCGGVLGPGFEICFVCRIGHRIESASLGLVRLVRKGSTTVPFIRVMVFTMYTLIGLCGLHMVTFVLD